MCYEASEWNFKGWDKEQERRIAKNIIMLGQDFYGLAWTVDFASSAHYAIFFIYNLRLFRLIIAENWNRAYFHADSIRIFNAFGVINYYLNHIFAHWWMEAKRQLNFSCFKLESSRCILTITATGLDIFPLRLRKLKLEKQLFLCKNCNVRWVRSAK